MDNLDFVSQLRRQVDLAVQRLLSQQDRDPYSSTYGCFDRRFWGWKLVDFPEATFQRNVYPLAVLYNDLTSQFYQSSRLVPAITAGLTYATKIQHPNGAFDQAFPYEQSFGATAFLLHPLLQTLNLIKPHLPETDRHIIESSLERAACFLCQHDEKYAFIANHLAGAVLSLLDAARYFQAPQFEQRAAQLLERILAHQSNEGWFLEYEGADPGYQTLCLYYLAQVYRINPQPDLEKALVRSLEFLQWFVHPNGTFGGLYGSRRTAVFYPGGIALLGQKYPLAQAIYNRMGQAIAAGQTTNLNTIDMGNLAPLVSNYVCALQVNLPRRNLPALPCDLPTTGQDFPEAGLYIRGTPRYYAIFGAGNGGTLKVLDKQKKCTIWDDGGYVGRLQNGAYLTTQITNRRRAVKTGGTTLSVETDFYQMLRSLPTPARFVILRLLNLTLMRNVYLGNLIKRYLVRLLISGKKPYSIRLKRKLTFEANNIIVEDTLLNPEQLPLRWLEGRQPFNSIHMASAGYYEGAQANATGPSLITVDVEALQREKTLQIKTVI